MKIFVRAGVASESINFVDENNVVLGWDAEQICCEGHSARVTRTEPKTVVDPKGSYTDWEEDMNEEEKIRFENGETIYRPVTRAAVEDVRFDFKDLYGAVIDLPGWAIDPEYNMVIGQNTVVFRLFNKRDEMFVVLQNFHNGYYAHGFKMDVGGIIKWKGVI